MLWRSLQKLSFPGAERRGIDENTAKLWHGRNKANLDPFYGQLGWSVRVGLVTDTFNEQLVASLPRLRRFARGLAGTTSQADDLVQAACERALNRQSQFQAGTKFDSWMFRIIQTIWIDQLRSRAVRKEEAEIEGETLGTDEPVRRVEARIALEEVRHAIARLPEEQRVALMLVTVDGFSYKEAAEIAKVPIGTVMSRLARARVALAAELERGRSLKGGSDHAAAK